MTICILMLTAGMSMATVTIESEALCHKLGKESAEKVSWVRKYECVCTTHSGEEGET